MSDFSNYIQREDIVSVFFASGLYGERHNILINGVVQKQLVIPNSVTSIGSSAFRGCSSLTSITIPNSVTSIGKCAFTGCSGLTSITIPNSVTSIGNDAFEGCSGLTSITIPNSVTSIGKYAFSNCSGLTSILVEQGNPVYDSRDVCNAIIETTQNNLIVGCNNTQIPNSVTSIGSSAFYNCSGLTSVTIPNSVTDIGRSAFYGCSGLTSVSIGNSVKLIDEYAFDGCSSLTSVYISDLAAWCKIRFRGYPSSNPTCWAHKLILNGTEIKDLVIPDGVKEIGEYAFYNCSGLTSVTIPNSVTRIGYYAFAGCSSLTSVTIPNSVTSIGENAFRSCSGLTSVNIFDLAAWCNIRFQDYGANPTYYSHRLILNGTEIKNLIIPDVITEIKDSAFEGCSFTSITIPSSVTRIGNNAFSKVENVSKIYSHAIIPPVLSSGFSDNVTKNAILYIPNTGNALTRYLTANYWKDFYNVQEMDMTGVETPTVSPLPAERSYYNLQGQRSAAPARGINIMNGKKILINR